MGWSKLWFNAVASNVRNPAGPVALRHRGRGPAQLHGHTRSSLPPVPPGDRCCCPWDKKPGAEGRPPSVVAPRVPRSLARTPTGVAVRGGASASDLPAPLPGRSLWPSLAWGWQQVPWAWTFSRGQGLTTGTPETRRNCQGLEALPPGPLGLELCPGACVLLSSTQKHPCQGAFPAGPPGASLHCILSPQDGKVSCASRCSKDLAPGTSWEERAAGPLAGRARHILQGLGEGPALGRALSSPNSVPRLSDEN